MLDLGAECALLRCLLGSAMLRPFPVRVACEVVVAGSVYRDGALLEVWPACSGYHVERWGVSTCDFQRDEVVEQGGCQISLLPLLLGIEIASRGMKGPKMWSAPGFARAFVAVYAFLCCPRLQLPGDTRS